MQEHNIAALARKEHRERKALGASGLVSRCRRLSSSRTEELRARQVGKRAYVNRIKEMAKQRQERAMGPSPWDAREVRRRFYAGCHHLSSHHDLFTVNIPRA